MRWFRHGENSPLAVAESFARGCPVVAADIGGLPELVTDEENGLLFASGDVVGLEEALQRLVGDEALEKRLSEGALQKAASLGIENYVPRLLAVYDSAVRSVGTPE